MGVFYLTREAFQQAALADPDTLVSARTIDRLLEDKSRQVENLTNRHFYPFTQTRSYDWSPQFGLSPIRLYLNADLLPTPTPTITVAGSTLTPLTDFFLEPLNYATDGGDQQSVSRVEIDLGNTGIDAFKAGSTPQRAIRITGSWGYSNQTVPAGALGVALTNTTGVAVQLSDSSLVGVGDLILIDSEWMIVTDKSLLDTTATLSSDIASLNNVLLIPVSNGALLHDSETITIDSERMSIEDIAGNNLIVRRSVQGTTLAAHSMGAAIYAPRTATVTRGAVGSVAATHLVSASLLRNFPPQAIATLVLAEAISTYHQEKAGYARTVGEGDGVMQVTGRSLSDIRKDVRDTYRRARGPVAV